MLELMDLWSRSNMEWGSIRECERNLKKHLNKDHNTKDYTEGVSYLPVPVQTWFPNVGNGIGRYWRVDMCHMGEWDQFGID